MKRKKIISNIITIISVILLIWIAISFMEVIVNNTSTTGITPEYSNWNLIVNILKLF